jgi:hypothetical protein
MANMKMYLFRIPRHPLVGMEVMANTLRLLADMGVTGNTGTPRRNNRGQESLAVWEMSGKTVVNANVKDGIMVMIALKQTYSSTKLV